MQRLQTKVLLLVTVLCAAAPPVKGPSRWVGPVVLEAAASMAQGKADSKESVDAGDAEQLLGAEDGEEDTTVQAEKGEKGSLKFRSRSSRLKHRGRAYLFDMRAKAGLGIVATLALLGALTALLRRPPVPASDIPEQEELQINWRNDFLLPLGVLTAYALILTLLTVGSLTYFHS